MAVMIDGLLDLDFWDTITGRTKDFVDYVYGLPEEKRFDVVHGLIYGIKTVKEKLYELSYIADGRDYVNEPA